MTVTYEQSRDLLYELGTRLSDTKGDKETQKILNEILSSINDAQKSLENGMYKFGNNNRANALTVANALKNANAFKGPTADKATGRISDREVERWNRAFGDTKNAANDLNRSLRGVSGAVSGFGKALNNVGTGFSGALSNLLKFDGTISSLTSSAASIASGIIGGQAIVAVLGRFAGALDQSIDSYRSLTNLGQDFGGNLLEISRVANRNGLTMEEFTKALENGSQGLRQFGGKNFAEASNRVRQAIHSMGNMGIKVENINEILSQYAEGLRVSGSLDEMNRASFAKTFQGLIKNSTSLAGAFGVSREEILKAASELSKSPEIAALTQGLEEDAKIRIKQFLGALNPEQQDRAKAALGAVQGDFSDKWAQLSVTAPEQMASLERTMTGLIQGQNLDVLLRDLQNSNKAQAQALKDIPTVLLRQDNEFSKNLASSITTANEFSNVNQNGVKAGDQFEQQTKATTELLNFNNTVRTAKIAWEDANMTAARAMETNIAKVAGEFNKAGTQITDFIRKLTEAVDTKGFSEAINIVIDGLKRLGVELDSPATWFKALGGILSGEQGVVAQIAGWAVAIGVAVTAFKTFAGIIGAFNAVNKLGGFIGNTLGGALGLGGKNAAAAAKDVGKIAPSATSNVGAAAEGSAGLLGKAGGFVKGVAKKAALLGVGISGFEGYMGWKEAQNEFDKGNIDENEMNRRKAHAIGSAGGTAAIGAAAGAAAGSAIPVLGTAAGAALGYGAGSFADFFGYNFGEEAADMFSKYMGWDKPTVEPILPGGKSQMDNMDLASLNINPTNNTTQNTNNQLNDKPIRNTNEDDVQAILASQNNTMSQLLDEVKRQPYKNNELNDKLLEALYLQNRDLSRIASAMDRIASTTA